MMGDIRPGRRGLVLTGLGALVTGIAIWASGERAGPTISVSARRLFAGLYPTDLEGSLDMKGMLRLALGGIAALTGLSMSNQATAQVAAERAPPEWIAYARVSGDTIQGCMGSDDPAAVRFKTFLESSWQDGVKPAPVLALRIWVDDRGTITRADFAPFAHAEANADLTGLLVGHVLGAPPKGMLLPLRLSISLAPAPRLSGEGDKDREGTGLK